ncbi:MAG: hypothetical protein ABI378_10795, partial [Chitinophagaceae bacterium]
MRKLFTLGLLLPFFISPSQAQTFTRVALVSPTLVSAPSGNLRPGALYKYANAAKNIDAYILFVKTTNTGTNAVGLFAFDNLASVNNPGGYDSSFQPVTSCSNTNSSGLWTPGGQCGQGYVKMSYSANQNYLAHFRIYFKKAGTTIDTALNLQAAFIDIDGFGSGTEAEQNAFMPGVSYKLASNTTLTVTPRQDGLLNVEGKPANVNGISFTAITALTQVTYLNRTYVDFAVGMNTHNANNAGGCYDAVSGGRLASVSFSQQPVFPTPPVVTPTVINLHGTVWDDADGSANNTFTNIKTNSETGTNAGGTYVYALDSATGTIVAQSTVSSNGTWSISDVPNGLPITLLLSSINLNDGVTNGGLTGTLPTNWVATAPLARPSFRPTVNLFNLDFGIEQLPLASTKTARSQKNPLGTVSVTVPASTFVTSDNDGTVIKIRLTAFPTNTTSITVGTTTYYPNTAALPTTCPTASCLVFPTAGVTTTTNTSGQPTTSIKLDPIDGTVTANIPFVSIDNANFESAAPGAAMMPFFEPLPPIAQNIDNAPINNSQPQTHIGQFVASDPQGDPILTYKVLSLPPASTGKLYTCSSNTVPCTGSYTLITINQVLTPAQIQALYFAPLNSFIGTTSFTYNASSQNGISNTATETIPIVNLPPTANSFTTGAVQKNSSNNPLPSLSGADKDGTVVSYQVTPPNPSHGSLTYCVTPPSTG